MNILQQIVEVKKNEVVELKKKYSKSCFNDSSFFNKESLGFAKSISQSKQLNLIAEIKKASPSKGVLRKEFNYKEVAEIYFDNTVAAVSVLTDEKFFHGSIKYLNDIARFKKAPLLRKEFIIDEIQIYESKANGADAILLIAEILSANQIKEFTLLANEIKIEVLLEIHSASQLDKIDFSQNKIIGINNRNLETFLVDVNNTFELMKFIPNDCIIVSESGISSQHSINKLKEKKVNAVLVGEYFMTATNIEIIIKEFQDWCKYES